MPVERVRSCQILCNVRLRNGLHGGKPKVNIKARYGRLVMTFQASNSSMIALTTKQVKMLPSLARQAMVLGYKRQVSWIALNGVCSTV